MGMKCAPINRETGYSNVLDGWWGSGKVVGLLPLLPSCRVLLLLRATPFPAQVADAVLGCARVLREVGAGEAGWTLAS